MHKEKQQYNFVVLADTGKPDSYRAYVAGQEIELGSQFGDGGTPLRAIACLCAILADQAGEDAAWAARLKAHPSPLAIWLTEQRKVRGLTQVEVARKTGVSSAEISMIESGGAEPTIVSVRRLVMKAYGKQVAELGEVLGVQIDSQARQHTLVRIGERVRDIRRARRITLKQFGDALGMSPTVLSRVERGKLRRVTCDIAAQIDQALEAKGEIFSLYWACPEVSSGRK